ncbi:MAG: SPFH domain-containing protein [Planctomycetota bacterium]
MSEDPRKGKNPVPEGWPPKGSWPLPGRIPLPGGNARRLVIVAVVVFLVMVVGGLFISGQGGIVEVADTEVAVVVNYVTGNNRLVTTPGFIVFIPWFQQAYKFDKSPNEFEMSGDRDRDNNHVRKLTVRANDGSNFWFERLLIQYQLLPARAGHVLEDSGGGELFKRNWVRAFARSVLRDEFGKYSADEVADPTNYTIATQAAKDRLNELLESHGVEIIQIITPKPKFAAKYEEAIEKRKIANQEVEKLKIKAIQLIREKERRLADVERDKATENELLLGELEASRIMAEKDRIEKERSADAYKIGELNRGKAEEQRMLQEARALAERARREAEGLNARVLALAERGEILVREALAAKLAGIHFEVVPYRRDPAPVRIEHMGGAIPVSAADRGGRRP